MEIIIPSDFLILSLFEALIKYEDIRNINIDDIYIYLNMYKDLLQRDYKDGFIPEEYKGKNITFKLDDFNLFDLISKYKNLFYVYNDKLVMNKDLEHKELNDFIRDKAANEKLPAFFTAPLDPEMNKEIFDYFNIHSIENFIRSFLKSEKALEELYNNLHYSHSKELYFNIKKHLLYRYEFINYIKTMPVYKVEAFDRISNMISNQEENYEYNVYPINIELWKKRKKKKDEYSEFADNIDSRVYDIDQYAIFCNKRFADLRMNKILDEIHFSMFSDMLYEEEQEELKNIESDFFDTEADEFENEIYSGDLAFNILYLKKLRLYMEEYGVNNNLIETYNRLLYATDGPELCLFIDKYILNEFNNLSTYDIDDSDLVFIKDEARFIAYEIFTEPENEYTIRKLIFLSTYYDLTMDNKIIKIINKHKKNKNYNKYTKIIFEKNENNLTLKK